VHRLILIPLMVLACFFFGRAAIAPAEPSTQAWAQIVRSNGPYFPDPAIQACEQATAAGYYTTDLYDQCLDDYAEVNLP
jgi:hypothetical protein